MDAQQILDDLMKQEESLRADLLDMEKNFNIKKEQYIKLQGAIEVLTLLEGESAAAED